MSGSRETTFTAEPPAEEPGPVVVRPEAPPPPPFPLPPLFGKYLVRGDRGPRSWPDAVPLPPPDLRAAHRGAALRPALHEDPHAPGGAAREHADEGRQVHRQEVQGPRHRSGRRSTRSRRRRGRTRSSSSWMRSRTRPRAKRSRVSSSVGSRSRVPSMRRPARRLNVAIRNIAHGRYPGLAQVDQADPHLPRGRDPPRRERGPDVLRRRPQRRSRAGRSVGALRPGRRSKT